MRERQLASPYSIRKGPPFVHNPRITTDSVMVLCDTHGAPVFAVKEGRGCLFGAENPECVPWSVWSVVTQHWPVEPISTDFCEIFRNAGPDVHRGTSPWSNRIINKDLVHSRISSKKSEVRGTVVKFIKLCNQRWMILNLAYLTSKQLSEPPHYCCRRYWIFVLSVPSSVVTILVIQFPRW